MLNNQDTAAERPAYRSGAAAKLTGIPVETLRVWERRYQVVGPHQSEKGQRLYSPAEVTRLKVVKQLVDAGYAIGSIAALNLEQLREMLDKDAPAAPLAASAPSLAATGTNLPLRLAAVGEGIGLRLEHHRLPSLQVAASSPSMALALESLREVKTDALIVELPTLQLETPQAIRALAQQVGARFVVVEYGFGPKQVEQELRELGYHLVHSPLDMNQLELLLGVLLSNPFPELRGVSPRRFNNKALAEIATTSFALNCECPQHLANLLVRLGGFETYSFECENRNPADAKLHHYLNQMAGSARVLLETALAHVVEVDGIKLTSVKS